MKRRRLLLASLLLLLPAAALSWLVLTESGLRGAAALMQRLGGNKLQLEQVSGRLADQIYIGALRWQEEDQRIHVHDIGLRWSPLALLRGTLQIDALALGAIDIETGNNKEAAHLPDSLALPLDVNIATLSVAALRIDGQRLADSASARLHSSGERHVLEMLTVRRGDLLLQAQGALSSRLPFMLDFDANLDGKLKDQDFSIALKANGDLQRTELSARRRAGPVDLDLQAVLRPFAEQPLTALALKTQDLDLAALLPSLPHTRINADCRMPEAQTLSDAAKPPPAIANCRLDNALAGPLDQQRLPMSQMHARLSNQDGRLQFSDLRLRHGSSVLQGRADWGGTGLNATLRAHAVDLSGIHGRVRPTRLNGAITLAATPDGQTLRAELRDNTLGLQLQLKQTAARLHIERLALTALDANITAQGHMDSRTQEFLATGRFERIDPGQFLRTAPGRLNGDFSAAGQLDAAPRLRFEFALRDSRLANAPATGGGQLELVWPHIRKANLALDLGPNRARMNGALGRPGDKLRVEIQAPKLAPYGIEGDLQLELEASGRLEAPQLRGTAHSTLLRLPGQGRISKLQMASDIGARPNDPMQIQLTFEQLHLASREHSVRKFALKVDGSRHQHEIGISAVLDEEMPLQVAARGGFADKGALEWQGALTQLTLTPGQVVAQRQLRLEGETPLLLGATRWSVGPANFTSDRSRLRLQGHAVAGRMQLSASADNPELGHASMALTARPQDVWQFSPQTPLRGRVQASIEDLAWFNALLGPMWRASGRLDADVQLAGTLQVPLLNGEIRGDKLGLRQLDTRMHLYQGSLRAHLRDSLLTLEDFSAQSELTAPPPALQRLLDDKGRALTATPGRISARGRMQLGVPGSAAAEALALEFTLERLGVAQTAQQWLLLSGRGRLSWQQARLGMQAKLGVDAAHWQLADLSRPQLSDDVIVHRVGKAGAEVQRLTPWSGEVQIALGRYFSFSGAGARGRLSGGVLVSASAQDIPRASGTVTLVDGRYEAYGQQLEIERGILNFQGLLENPALNIVALRKGLPVEAGVAITGFAQAPQVRLVSEPNVPDAEKLSWLVLGRPPQQDGNDSGVLMAAVGAIFGGQSSAATQQLKDSFGIDEISVRSGTPGQGQTMRSSVVTMGGSTASSGQVLAVGKQLSNRLRLSYEQALGGATSLVKLTFKLSDHVSVVGTSGTDAALDMFYSFSFGGKPARPH